VLFISYFFPPTGGAGVQRTLKFVRHLPAHGYEPVVVAGPGEEGRRWDPLDASLTEELPPNVRVVRVPGPIPVESGGLRPRAERWLNLPSRFSRWWVEGATKAALEVAREADLVVASMSPFESAEVAAYISETVGVPWVADLRDPWALDEMVVYPTGIHRRLDKRRMGKRLTSAAAVVMNTKEATHRLRDAFDLDTPVVTITNGFDADDFTSPVLTRADSAFRIVHAGYLHTELGEQHRVALGITPGPRAPIDPDDSAVVQQHLVELRRVAADRPRQHKHGFCRPE
jgi:glycosyltransferase involved in cell wall biosynthesis